MPEAGRVFRGVVRGLTILVALGLAAPAGAATLAPGDILVAEPDGPTALGSILLVNPATGAQTIVSSAGSFRGPNAIAIGGGDLFVTDWNDADAGRIIRVDPATGAQTIVSSGGNLAEPTGIVFAANGDLVVADAGDEFNPGRIIRVDPATGAQTIVSSGVVPGDFRPRSIALAADGDFLVVDPPHRQVVRVDPATGARTVVSAGGSLGVPAWVAIAADGNLYVTDNNGAVVRVDATSGAQTIVSAGGLLVCPVGIAIDASGDLLISDPCNEPGAVVRVSPTTGAQTLVSIGGSFISPQGFAIVPGAFRLTGGLTNARSGHTAALLPGGKVLIAGGIAGATLDSAEVYDPATGTFGVTGGMTVPRVFHTATRLPDGKVLIAGGNSNNTVGVSSAEVYAPATGTFSPTGSMTVNRVSHTATLLGTGKVLIVGGYNGSYLASAELYDPATGAFSMTGSAATSRYGHTATLLSDGRVLVVGDPFLRGAVELYDPATGTFTSTGGTTVPRFTPASALLGGGWVLVAGGTSRGGVVDSAELYDPASGTFGATGSMATAAELRTATRLRSGQVLVAGGQRGGTVFAGAELYDGAGGAFAAVGSMTTPRTSHTATLLDNGQVLLAGGSNGTVALASAELYTPPGPPPNNPPIAHDQSLTTAEGAPIGFNLSGSDPEGSPLTFAIVAGPSHGTLTGSGAGRTYTPDADFNGPDSFTFTVSDGSLTSPAATVAITVTPVNDPPRFDPIADQAVVEDAGPQTLPITEVSPGPPDEAGQTVTLTAVSSNPGLVPNPTISGVGATRTLAWAPAAEASGVATITVTAKDDGGTADGGTDTFSRTFTITVLAVNDPPRFDPIADQTVFEDAGAQAVTITGVSPGPADEAGQTVTVTATSSNPAVLPQPTVTGTGATRTLSYVPLPDANGTATISVVAQDDGGTVNGGMDTFSRTFTVTVLPVNDPPTVDAIADQMVAEDAGPQTLTITGVSPGPPDEAGQTVTLTAASSNPAAVPHPTVTGTGATRTLAYAPASNATGTVTITVVAQDNGGTASGGVDSVSRTFTINVTPADDAPVAAADAYTVLEDMLLAVAAPGVLGNDSDIDSGTLTALLVSPPVHGQLTLNADGSFTYQPDPNYKGEDAFTYKAYDGTLASNVATVTITVTPANDAPVLAPIGNRAVVEGQLLQFTVSATDADADTLALTATGLPPDATFDTQTGTFSYTPGFGVANSGADSFFDVFFQVSDGQGGMAGETVRITVTDVPGGTPAGSNVVAEPVDATTGTSPVTLTFANVTQPGQTSLTTLGSGPAPPSGFKLGTPATYYDVTTTATFTGSVTICVKYTGVSFKNEAKLKLLHFENGAWVNVTTTLDTANDVICGSATSLSPFAIGEPSELAVTIDIRPHKDVNKVKPKSHGKIRVAILSTADFDAPGMVEVASLTFGRTGNEPSLGFCRVKDVNHDRRPDLDCQFSLRAAGFQRGDTQGILKGRTTSGLSIVGVDSVKTPRPK